mmetsp:Transcript_24879/g.39950  ORF Transcript_24879/g.39950 Transcript_24879/m.39950 type:complete len:846 (+) Transcript_24879:53-2590(+)
MSHQPPAALANVEESIDHRSTQELSDDRPTTPDRADNPAPKDTPLKLNRQRVHADSSQQAEDAAGAKGPKNTTAEEDEWSTQARWAMQAGTTSTMQAQVSEVVPRWPSSVEFVAPPPGLDLDPRSAEVFSMPNEEGEEDFQKFQNSAKHSASVHRQERIVQIIYDALCSAEAPRWKDRDGYVAISKLLRSWSDLQRSAFGSTKVIVQAVEQCNGIIRLDQERRCVRLQSCEDVVLSTVEQEVEKSHHKSLPWSTLLALPALSQALEEGKLTNETREDFLHRVVRQGDSKVFVKGAYVVLRPRCEQLRRIVEELFTDVHLSQDQRLRTKISESQGGEVPLTWLCSKYAERLGSSPAGDARSAEETAAELCDALHHSETLDVDAKRLNVKRKMPIKTNTMSAIIETGRVSPQFSSPVARGVRDSPPSTQSERQRTAGSARAAAQLRQLLDFYFEPFSLQHNRYILDLIARRIGVPSEAGPWVVEALLTFRFTIDDLLGLGRIKSAFEKLKGSGDTNDLMEITNQLKFLRTDNDGSFQLQSPPEVRSFVASRTASLNCADATARYLSAAREQRGQAPDGVLSVLSCAMIASLFDDTDLGSQRLGRLKRQLSLHHADIICLQGLDADVGAGASLATTLSEEGYAFACAKSGDGAEANSIFWDRSRWENVAKEECGAAICVDLEPFEEPKTLVRAICFRPRVPTTKDGSRLQKLFEGPELKLVCADFTLLGGAHGACVVEELSLMPSVSQEVLGAEISIPRVGPDYKPLRAAASGMNKLHCPDAVLFSGMSPIVALSGHTEGYFSTLSAEDFQQQFPAFRMPIVAAFDRRNNFQLGNSNVAKFGSTRHRL